MCYKWLEITFRGFIVILIPILQSFQHIISIQHIQIHRILSIKGEDTWKMWILCIPAEFIRVLSKFSKITKRKLMVYFEHLKNPWKNLVEILGPMVEKWEILRCFHMKCLPFKYTPAQILH
jgi:hypothetical protein